MADETKARQTDNELSKLQGKRMVDHNTWREQYSERFEKDAEEHRQALQKIIDGGIATRVRILTNHDSCPVCKSVEGAYDFDKVPELPLEGCSHPAGCRCHYAPVLDLFGP